MAECLVTADHARSYDSPITGAAGDRLIVVRPDDEAPGWIWCEHAANGLAGWVPEAFLERDGSQAEAVLRRNYSAMELSVAAGQRLAVLETVDGWCWCVGANGERGWVPADKVSILEQHENSQD